MVGDRGVAFRAPVAQRVAGCGADDERRLPVVGPLPGSPFPRFVRDRDVPADPRLLQTERLDETADRIQYVFAGARGNAFAHEQTVQILAARAVIADAAVGVHGEAQEIAAQRHLHVQQRVEAAPGQLTANRPIARAARALVEGQEFDAGDVADQFAFQLADDPGQAR